MSAATTLVLASVLDMRAAAPLKAELAAHGGAALDLDASQVERVGGLCAQQLIAAALAWRGAGLAFRVTNASLAFSEDVARLGAVDLVYGSEAPC
jgi:chemotaxis protein CheX